MKNRLNHPARICGPARRMLVSLALALALAASLDTAHAAEIWVNEAVPDGCTLHDAVRAANADAPRGDCTAGSGADTIKIVAPGQIHIGNNDLDIQSVITIEPAADAGMVEVFAGFARVFDVRPGASLVLHRIVVGRGFLDDVLAGGGAGIRVEQANLAIHDSVIEDCQIGRSTGGGGAILARDASVNIVDSLIQNNRSGGMAPGVGIDAINSSVQVLRSELRGDFSDSGTELIPIYRFRNSAVTIEESLVQHRPWRQGSRTLLGLEDSTNLLLLNSTVSDEGRLDRRIALDDSTVIFANSTVGIFDIESGGSPGTAHFINSILLGECRPSLLIGDVINSLFTSSTCNGAATPSFDLKLLTLTDQGGPTPTRALLPGSVALDSASPSDCPDTDQRGVPRTASECDIGAFELVAEADVQISAVPAISGPYFVDQVVPYNLNVFNGGPDTAYGVEIDLQLNNATLQSVDGDCTALPCELGALIADDPFQQIQIEVVPIANGADEFTVTATALPAPDSVYNELAVGDNTSSTTRMLSPAADVRITKELLDGPPYFIGQTIDYEIVVTNHGPDTATSVVVTDTPEGLDIANISNCSGPSDGPCTFAGLGVGSSQTLDVSAEITSTVFDNTADVSADEADPVPGNNIDDRRNGGSTENDADLRIGWIALSPPPYINSGFLDYEIEVRNAGPDTATNVRVNVDVGTGRYLIFNVVGDCGPSLLPCELGNIPPGAAESFLIQGQFVSDGPESVSIYAQADQNDADPETNEGSDSFTISEAVDVVASMELLSEPPYFEDDLLTYEIVVANIGFNSADNVLIDVTPDNLDIDSVLSVNCVALPCTVPTVGPTETILVTARPQEVGAFDLTLTAAADQIDTVPANNIDDTGNGGTAEADPADQIFVDSFEAMFSALP